MDDLEQKIKEELLQDLIERMSDGLSDRVKPKGLAVEVAAPNKEKLAQGLDKAKSVIGSEDDESEVPGHESGGMSDEESDEQRLMQLLEDEDEEDGQPGRR